MKPGDRVLVIASDNEYVGKAGTISGLTKDGQVIVDVEVQVITWPITFKAHDIELEARVGKVR